MGGGSVTLYSAWLQGSYARDQFPFNKMANCLAGTASVPPARFGESSI